MGGEGSEGRVLVGERRLAWERVYHILITPRTSRLGPGPGRHPRQTRPRCRFRTVTAPRHIPHGGGRPSGSRGFRGAFGAQRNYHSSAVDKGRGRVRDSSTGVVIGPGRVQGSPVCPHYSPRVQGRLLRGRDGCVNISFLTFLFLDGLGSQPRVVYMPSAQVLPRRYSRTASSYPSHRRSPGTSKTTLVLIHKPSLTHHEAASPFFSFPSSPSNSTPSTAPSRPPSAPFSPSLSFDFSKKYFTTASWPLLSARSSGT